MPFLRALLPIAAVCVLSVPAPALAWEAPAGAPPGWKPQWVQTTVPTSAFIHAEGDNNFGQVAAGLYFRVDAPEQHGRLWTYDPLSTSWAWLPSALTRPVPEPTPDDVAATTATLDPKLYLYLQAPDVAPRLDCIINGESGWDPSQVNVRTHAAGLAQFLPSTWATTPQAQEGLSVMEPQANLDAAIWLARTRGWRQWQVYTEGFCP